MANNILTDSTLQKIADIFSEHAEKFVEIAKDNLRKKGQVASGDLYESIRFETQIMGQDVVVDIYMEDYWVFVEEGRRAGSFPPVSAIKQWIKDKGIIARDNSLQQGQRSLQQRENSLAYLIGRKIEREGIPPRPFTPEIDTQKIVEDIEQRVSDDVASDIKMEILKGTSIFS